LSAAMVSMASALALNSRAELHTRRANRER
jgi:hypothetical protein